MSIVYVVQSSLTLVDGELIPKHDLRPAEKFGTLVHLLTPSTQPFPPGPVIRKLREGLANYSAEDYILLIGNPALIGFAAVIASQQTNGRIRLLQWDGRRRLYAPIVADLSVPQ